jgi:hypothetical protein
MFKDKCSDSYESKVKVDLAMSSCFSIQHFHIASIVCGEV